MTREGFKELIEKAKNKKYKIVFVKPGDKFSHTMTKLFSHQFHEFNNSPNEIDDLYNDLCNGTISDFYFGRATSLRETREFTQEQIEKYLKNIQGARSDDDKLFAIADFIKEMHQYHPFSDGNGRLFIFLLLNKLLLQNNLKPTMAPSPGKFSGHTTEQLVREIKDGWDIVKSILTSRKEKKSDFMDYLYQTTFKNRDEFLFLFLRIDPVGCYQKYGYDNEIKKFVDNNLEKIYFEELPFIHDKKSIDLIFSTTPATPEVLWKTMELAAKYDNKALFEMCLKNDALEFPINSLRALGWLSSIKEYGEGDCVKEILNKLNISQKDIIVCLNTKVNTKNFPDYAFDQQGNNFLTQLILDDNFFAIRNIFDKLDPGSIITLLNNKYDSDVNVLQHMFSQLTSTKNILDYCCDRISTKVVLELLEANDFLKKIDSSLGSENQKIRIEFSRKLLQEQASKTTAQEFKM